MKIENKIRKEERFKKKKWTYQMGSKDLTGSEKFQSKFNQETIARSFVHDRDHLHDRDYLHDPPFDWTSSCDIVSGGF